MYESSCWDCKPSGWIAYRSATYCRNLVADCTSRNPDEVSVFVCLKWFVWNNYVVVWLSTLQATLKDVSFTINAKPPMWRSECTKTP